jgi:hypothetical protein
MPQNPLLTLTKDRDLRFTCRIEGYLHPNTPEAKQYIYKHNPTPNNPQNKDVYVVIKGEMDYSIWDARHEILMGSLFDFV